jgi:antitoxin (DNA-binding transcriptional repressor) of toxin-antitoxin stability system
VTAEIAEVRRNVDDLLEEVKAGEPVEIVVRDEAVAEVAPMPKYHFLREDGTIEDQTEAYERVEQLVREGVLEHGFRPLPEDFFTRELPTVQGIGLVEELLQERYSDDDL